MKTPNVFAWYAADTASPTDTPYNDGNSVATWRDLSTADRSAASNGLTAITTAPIFKANIVNGRPIVRFAGSPGYLRTDNVVFKAGGYTLFAVVQVTGSSAVRAFIDADAGVAPRIFNFRTESSAAISLYGANTVPSLDWSGSPAATVANWNVYSGHYDGRTIAAFVNGNVSTRTVTSDTPNSGTHNMGVGATSLGSNFLIGDIAELLIYSPALPEFQRQQVEQYLGRKYLIQVSR